MNRAGEGNRTPDLLITNQLLYQLSYSGKFPDNSHVYRNFSPLSAMKMNPSRKKDCKLTNYLKGDKKKVLFFC